MGTDVSLSYITYSANTGIYRTPTLSQFKRIMCLTGSVNCSFVGFEQRRIVHELKLHATYQCRDAISKQTATNFVESEKLPII